MISSEKITLRPVTSQDDNFLLSLYASTRSAELAQVPWSPEQKEAFLRMQFNAQKQHYATEYPQANHDLICVDGVPVGTATTCLFGRVAWLALVLVESSARRQGNGQGLLEHALAFLDDTGVASVSRARPAIAIR